MKSFIFIIIIVVIVFGGYLLLRNNETPADKSTSATPTAQDQIVPSEPGTPPVMPAESQAEEPIITYTDAGYSPKTITIRVGETVTWKNDSSKTMWPASAMHPTHIIYSGTPIGEHCPDVDGTAFDACMGVQHGGAWSFTFTKQGTWKYHDHLKPSDTGTVIVE